MSYIGNETQRSDAAALYQWLSSDLEQMREMLKRLKSRSNIEEEGIGREKGVFSDHESSFLTWLNERGSLLPLHQKEYSRVEHRRLREGYEAEMLRLTMQTPTFRTFKNY